MSDSRDPSIVSPPPPDASTFASGSWLGRARLIASDIKLSHSVFALPFALLGMFLAAGSVDRLPRPGEAGLIVLAMVVARTLAMTMNRWADAGLDAANPRTQDRAIPSGRLGRASMLGVAGASALLLLLVCAAFLLAYDNPWPLMGSPLVLAWLIGYSFTKRFTALCHLILGGALAMSPIAAALAVEPAYAAHASTLLIAGAVVAWVAGFDVIYALQDIDVDRKLGLRSIPSRLGRGRGLAVARLLHVVAVALLIGATWAEPALGAGFAGGIAAMILLLTIEHVLAGRENRRARAWAFVPINGLISLLVGVAGIVDVVRTVVGR